MRWWCALALFAATVITAAVGQLAGYGPGNNPRPRLELASEIFGGIALTALPFAIGWQWRHLLLACFAVGGAIVLGLIVADALTYSTVWHNCNYPQTDACDPGPFPATFMTLGLPFPLGLAALGRLVRGGSHEIRKRGREQAHLLVGTDGDADRAGGAEGS